MHPTDCYDLFGNPVKIPEKKIWSEPKSITRTRKPQDGTLPPDAPETLEFNPSRVCKDFGERWDELE
jgi:hypothetical protein